MYLPLQRRTHQVLYQNDSNLIKSGSDISSVLLFWDIISRQLHHMIHKELFKNTSGLFIKPLLFDSKSGYRVNYITLFVAVRHNTSRVKLITTISV